jgi:hypothetical protein
LDQLTKEAEEVSELCQETGVFFDVGLPLLKKQQK